jgi:hypothetical protein
MKRRTEWPWDPTFWPVMANFYMEHFEQTALNTGINTSALRYRYADTSVVWSHRKDALEEFLERLNNIYQNTKFTMETEEKGGLHFIDVLVTRRLGGTLGHTVLRKPTHMDPTYTPNLITTQHRN